MIKKTISLLLAVAVLCSLSAQVCAADYVDMDKEGSITLELKYDGKPVTGGKFSCIKVADVVYEDGEYFFVRLLEREEYRGTLPDVDDIYEYVQDNKEFFATQKVSHTNTDGVVRFTSRMPGLYLIIQETSAPGYVKMNPFLVTLPYLKDGRYVYDVTANTKPALEPEEKPATPKPDPGDKLPQTGQLNWPVPVLAVGGLALFTVGWFLRFGKKKNCYET